MERVNILGVGVSPINMEQALNQIGVWITTGEKQYICVRDVHGIIESQWDSHLCQIHNSAGLVTPDGMPLVWLSKLMGHKSVSRVYGPDLMLAVCNLSLQKGFSHYFYGGAKGVPECLADRLQSLFPGLKVVGTYSPPFRPLTEQEDEDIVQMINKAQPDIVWVGLSTPKQERWMASHTERLNASVLIGVGAAFDFHSGRKPQAPAWMQRSGLEWLFRLGTEPRRLWRRYIVVVPLFIILIVLQKLGIYRYKLPE